MQIHELKGVFPSSFKVCDSLDDEEMEFKLDADPDHDGSNECYAIDASLTSDHNSNRLRFDIPIASGDTVEITAIGEQIDEGVVKLSFTREWFLSFIKATINLQEHQHGE